MKIPWKTWVGLIAIAMITALSAPAIAASDHVVHQFGAVSYLDDSGFYGVGDAPAVLNRMPAPEFPNTPAWALDSVIAMTHIWGLCPGGEGGDGPDSDPGPTPEPPAPDGGGGGTESSDNCVAFHLRL